MAKDISDKYLDAPNTTNFGIMFCLSRAYLQKLFAKQVCWSRYNVNVM